MGWWVAWFALAVYVAAKGVAGLMAHWLSRPDYDLDAAWAAFRNRRRGQ
jgi:hypothetical protein